MVDITGSCRPHGTTANPNWAHATCPLDLVPTTDDPQGEGAEMVRLVGNVVVTQGEYAGERMADVMMDWQEALLLYLFGQMIAGRRQVRKCL